MSEIVKTEAIVLNKVEYGDTSVISTLYTRQFGKLSAILKGGRNPKSKMNGLIDPINYLQLVLYKKDNRDIQLISGAELITYYSRIREDYNKLKFSCAVIELIKKLTVDHEANDKLFRGVTRILSLIEASNEPDEVLFGRFFLFLLKETGFELQFEKCVVCGKTKLENCELSYNLEMGILCPECGRDFLESFKINAELFNYLLCLKYSKHPDTMNKDIYNRASVFMEKYLMFHFPEFSGIQSFHLLK